MKTTNLSKAFVMSALMASACAALKLLQKYPTGKGSNWVEIVSFD